MMTIDDNRRESRTTRSYCINIVALVTTKRQQQQQTACNNCDRFLIRLMSPCAIRHAVISVARSSVRFPPLAAGCCWLWDWSDWSKSHSYDTIRHGRRRWRRMGIDGRCSLINWLSFTIAKIGWNRVRFGLIIDCQSHGCDSSEMHAVSRVRWGKMTFFKLS